MTIGQITQLTTEQAKVDEQRAALGLFIPITKIKSQNEKDRRERIATACLQGILAFGEFAKFEDEKNGFKNYCINKSIEFADALIAELDK